MGREATPRGCPRLGPGLTGRDRWALLRGAARSLRAERRQREGLEESAACSATAALIPGVGRERGAGGGGEGAAGRGRGAGRGSARTRAGAGCAHTRARTHALSRTPSSALPRSSLLGFPLPPALRARRESRSRPPGACSARDPNLGRVHAFPAQPLPWRSADLVPCRGDWPGLAWAGWAPPPRCPSQGTMGALSPRPARANFMFNLRLIRLSPWKRAA